MIIIYILCRMFHVHCSGYVSSHGETRQINSYLPDILLTNIEAVNVDFPLPCHYNYLVASLVELLN
jgi:hypothetical protein